MHPRIRTAAALCIFLASLTVPVTAASIQSIDLDDPYRRGDTVNVSVTAEASPVANLSITVLNPQGQTISTVTYTGLESQKGVVHGNLYYQIPANASRGDWAVDATVRQEDGSTDSGTATFTVEGRRPVTAYLSFPHLEHGATFSQGGRLPIEITVRNGTGHAITDASVSCQFQSAAETRLQPRGNGWYTAAPTVTGESGYGALQCTATKQKGNQVVDGENLLVVKHSLHLLRAAVTAPDTFPAGEAVVNVSVTMDENPVRDAVAWIVEDGRRTNTRLRPVGNGMYQIRYTPGESVSAVAVDVERNGFVTRSAPLTSSGGKTLFILIGVVTVIVIVIGLLFAGMETRGTERGQGGQGGSAREEMQAVLGEVEDLIGKIRSLQRRYARGELEEDTYKRLLHRYQEEKAAAADRIGELRAGLPPGEREVLRTVELRILAEDLKNLAERLEHRGANTYPEIVRIDRVIDNVGDDMDPDAAANELSIIEDTLHEKQDGTGEKEGGKDTGGPGEQAAAGSGSDTETRGGGGERDVDGLVAGIRSSLTRLEENGVDVDLFKTRLAELEGKHREGVDVTSELDELKKHVEDRELYEGLKDLQRS